MLMLQLQVNTMLLLYYHISYISKFGKFIQQFPLTKKKKRSQLMVNGGRGTTILSFISRVLMTGSCLYYCLRLALQAKQSGSSRNILNSIPYLE
jgi:hypothetical protein